MREDDLRGRDQTLLTFVTGSISPSQWGHQEAGRNARF